MRAVAEAVGQALENGSCQPSPGGKGETGRAIRMWGIGVSGVFSGAGGFPQRAVHGLLLVA